MGVEDWEVKVECRSMYLVLKILICIGVGEGLSVGGLGCFEGIFSYCGELEEEVV